MDSEIKAMSEIMAALEGLDPDAVARVLRWAAEKYEVVPGKSTQGEPFGEGPDKKIEFNDLHEVFDAANPTSGPDKALVVGYWFQDIKGDDELGSFRLNNELKNLGHQSTNITRDLNALMNRSPRLVVQIKKEGKSRQSRKKYKLTREGIKVVERMISGNDQG